MRDNPQQQPQEIKELQKAITLLEEQRDTLGDAAVNAAVLGLRARLTELASSGFPDRDKTPTADSESERRIMTILFCDVAGSTRLAEGMDPEAWTAIMNTAFEKMIDPIERYDGTVARLMGDAILAFFGAPTAHEDDPQRAVLAGLAILENIKPLSEKLKRENGLEFNLRVGINTGLAVVGKVGSGTAGEYTAMGDAVNVAARMEQTAAPGTVQIAHDTYTLVQPLFDIHALGGIAVKGKDAPVHAYQVAGRKTQPGSLRGLGGHGISSPLVGRQEEFAAGEAALERLRNGEGGILAVVGEAGIGKSRLLAELRRANNERDQETELQWIEGHSLSYGQAISYWPFQEIVRSCAGIGEKDDQPTAWGKLESAVGELFEDGTAEILPYLASMLSIDVGGEYAARVEFLDAEALGHQVYRSVRLFFQHLAQKRPLVLVFDDIHWMDVSSAGLLEHLLPLVKRVPLLICGISRPVSESPALELRAVAADEYANRYSEITLRPLSAADSKQLIQNLMAVEGLPAHTRQMMVNRADGNPFYLEEIMRELIESGAIRVEPATGRWRATPAAKNIMVPDTIQGLILARIDRLDDDLKHVVRRAAVIGRTFLFRVLSAILSNNFDLEQQLDRLQQIDLINEKQRIPELAYIFKHALAQEAVYDSILWQERRELHAQTGAAIESLMADQLDVFYGLLAYHYSAAERWDQAQHYLFKAGDQAQRMAADAEALAHYRQAMEAYARVRGDDWEPLDRARLERKIGEALFRLGKHKQARPYLVRALALLGQELPSSKWRTRLAFVGALFTQAMHRLWPGRLPHPSESLSNSEMEEIYKAVTALGWISVFSNPEFFILVTIKGLNYCERVGYALGSANFASAMGTGADVTGHFSLAERYFRLSAQYAQQIIPKRPVAQLEVGLSSHYNLLGDLDKLAEHAGNVVNTSRSIGDLSSWGLAMTNLVWAGWYRGQYEECVRLCKDLSQAAEESSDQQLLLWSLLPYGCVQRRMGQVQEAVATLQRALEIARDLPDYLYLGGSGAWLGRSYTALGEIDQAIAVLEAAEKIHSESGGGLPIFAVIGTGLAEAYLAVAEKSSGVEKETWLKKAKDVIRRTLKKAASNRLTLAEAYLLKGRYEWLSGKPQAARKSWQQGLAKAQEFGLIFEESMIYLEIGRRLGDRDSVQRAAAILDEIGAAFDLSLAKKALESL